MKFGGVYSVRFAIGITLALILAACAGPVSSMQTSMQEPPDYMLEGLIPELTLPDGAQQVGGGGGGGGYAAVTGIFFIGEVGINEAEQHFADLLSEAGWRFISREASEDEVTVFWELTDADGGIWSGRLKVVHNPPGFPDTFMAEVGILLPQ
jgi:hypothetical protein